MAHRNLHIEMDSAVNENGLDIYCDFSAHLGAWHRYAPDAPTLNKAAETIKNQAGNHFHHHYPEGNAAASLHEMCIYSLMKKQFYESEKNTNNLIRYNEQRAEETKSLSDQINILREVVEKLTDSYNNLTIVTTDVILRLNKVSEEFGHFKHQICDSGAFNCNSIHLPVEECIGKLCDLN